MEPEHTVPTGERYTVGGKEYIVFDRPSSEGGGTYVYDVSSGDRTAYGTFVGRVWRTYKPGVGDYDAPVIGERLDVPASTASLPLTYVKRVNVAHLDSIAKLGLIADKTMVAMSGYSAGTKYASRDMYLLAVWLGKTNEPGSSMQPDKGIYVDLTIQINPLFRDMYLRDIKAVLHGEDTTFGNTALCFAPIPPTWISMTITEKVRDAIVAKYSSVKLLLGQQTLPVLYRNLNLIAAALTALGEEKQKK